MYKCYTIKYRFVFLFTMNAVRWCIFVKASLGIIMWHRHNILQHCHLQRFTIPSRSINHSSKNDGNKRLVHNSPMLMVFTNGSPPIRWFGQWFIGYNCLFLVNLDHQWLIEHSLANVVHWLQSMVMMVIICYNQFNHHAWL